MTLCIAALRYCGSPRNGPSIRAASCLSISVLLIFLGLASESAVVSAAEAALALRLGGWISGRFQRDGRHHFASTAADENNKKRYRITTV